MVNEVLDSLSLVDMVEIHEKKSTTPEAQIYYI